MNIAGLFLRVLDNNGDVYPPCHFDGDWTNEEKAAVMAALAPHVPVRVNAMFNEWRFWKTSHSDGTATFGGKKATWDLSSWWAGTAQELAGKVTEYYTTP